MRVGAATLSQVGDAIVYFALGWAARGYGAVAAGLVLAGTTVTRTVFMLVGVPWPIGSALAPSG